MSVVLEESGEKAGGEGRELCNAVKSSRRAIQRRVQNIAAVHEYTTVECRA